MSSPDSLSDTLVGIAAIVAIIVPFGTALYWVGVTRAKLNRLEEDVKELKNDVKNLSARVDVHISVMDVLTQLGLLGKGEKPKE